MVYFVDFDAEHDSTLRLFRGYLLTHTSTLRNHVLVDKRRTNERETSQWPSTRGRGTDFPPSIGSMVLPLRTEDTAPAKHHPWIIHPPPHRLHPHRILPLPLRPRRILERQARLLLLPLPLQLSHPPSPGPFHEDPRREPRPPPL